MKKNVEARRERNRERNKAKKANRENAQERDDIELVRDELRVFKKHHQLRNLLKTTIERRPFGGEGEGGEILVRHSPKEGQETAVLNYLDTLPLAERNKIRAVLDLK